MDTRNEAYRAQNNYENYRWCYENGHEEWMHRAKRNVDFFCSRQWTEADIARNTAGGRPSLTINIIESLVRAMVGVQRALRNDVRFAPVEDADNNDAQVQDNLWMHEQAQNDLDFVEAEVWLKGMLTGRGYYDIRQNYDDQLRGQIKIKPRRSQDVIMDAAIDSYDPDDWTQLFVSRWVNLQNIEHWFGKDAAEALSWTDMPGWYNFEDTFMAQRLGRLPYYSYIGQPDKKLIRAYRLLERQYTELKMREMFVNLKTGDMQRIPKEWDRNKIAHILSITPGLGTLKRKVQQMKWMVTCENEVLHDEDSAYEHFTIVPFFATFLDGETLSPVDVLIDPQIMYNKTTSKEVEIINTSANSGLKITRKGLKAMNMTREQLEEKGSKPGSVFVLDEITDMEKIQPNNLPQGHDRISMKAEAIMRNLGGVSNQSRGFAREDVAGEAIMENQAGMQINFAGMLSNLHRSKQLLARRCQDIWQSSYDEERVIMINRGTTFKPEYEQMVLNGTSPEGEVINDVTKGKYRTTLVPSPSRTALTQDEFDQLIQMREKLGIQIPDDVLIELSPVPNKAALIQRLKVDSNQKAQQEQQQQQEAHEHDQALAKAKITKQEASAKLDVARANKAQSEAGKDPDAAYKEVEMQRIALDRQKMEEQLKLEWAEEDRQEREGKRRDAIEMTKADRQGLPQRKTA